MPTPNNPFEQIIIPIEAPSAWPPAPIYWLILAAAIIVITLTTVFIKRYLKRQIIVKKTLILLKNLQQDNANFAQLNQLLKGLSLHYYARKEVASLTGQAWFAFLQEHNVQQSTVQQDTAQQNKILFNDRDEFCRRLYQQNSTCTEQDFASAKKWIQHFPEQVKTRQKLVLKNDSLAGKAHV